MEKTDAPSEVSAASMPSSLVEAAPESQRKRLSYKSVFKAIVIIVIIAGIVLGLTIGNLAKHIGTVLEWLEDNIAEGIAIFIGIYAGLTGLSLLSAVLYDCEFKHLLVCTAVSRPTRAWCKACARLCLHQYQNMSHEAISCFFTHLQCTPSHTFVLCSGVLPKLDPHIGWRCHLRFRGDPYSLVRRMSRPDTFVLPVSVPAPCVGTGLGE